jgi:predicted ferric reductase
MFINLPFVLTYIVMALKEIYSSNRVNLIEKIMWTICLIGLNWFAGLIYLLFARKRVLRKFKVLSNDTGAFA